MAGKTTSLDRQTKQGKSGSGSRVSQAKSTARKRTAVNKKILASVAGVAAAAGVAAVARKKNASKMPKNGKGPERNLQDGTKGGREIKEEIPEALALFLEVYGRL